MRHLLVILMLAGCASWAPTRNAVVRRQAESKLRSCVQFNCQFTKQCIKESVAFCKSNGLESTCGSDGMFTSMPNERIMCSPTDFRH